MAGFMGIDNSIGWAHWKLKGGWKNLLISVLGYTGVIVGLIFLTIHMADPRYPGAVDRALSTWRIVLLYLQAGIVTLLGGSRVAVAIRSDISNRMAESHALMPVPPLAAVSGYIWGPTIQPIGLMLANFLIGLGVCLRAGYGLGIWIGPNIVLIAFALFCWVVAAFSAFVAKLGWGAVFGSLIVIGFSQGMLLPFVPALMVLTTPFIGNSVFVPSIGNYDFDPAIYASIIAQVCVGAILYFGAARKYRRPDQTALAVQPGMLLLMAWVAASFVGIRYFGDFRVRSRYGMSSDPEDLLWVLICGIGSSMLVALVPLANASRDRRSGPSSPLLAMLCAGIVSLLCISVSTDLINYSGPIVFTALAVASFLVSMCYVLRLMYRATPRGWQIGLIWTAIMWLVPNLVDYGLWAMRDTDESFLPTVATAVSPIGLIVMAWRNDLVAQPTALAIGCAVQIALAIGWMLLFILTDRSQNAVGSSD